MVQIKDKNPIVFRYIHDILSIINPPEMTLKSVTQLLTLGKTYLIYAN